MSSVPFHSTPTLTLHQSPASSLLLVMACIAVTLRLIAPVYCSFKISPWSAQLSHVLILLSIVIGAPTTPVRLRSHPRHSHMTCFHPATNTTSKDSLKHKALLLLPGLLKSQVGETAAHHLSLSSTTCWIILTHAVVHMVDHCSIIQMDSNISEHGNHILIFINVKGDTSLCSKVSLARATNNILIPDWAECRVVWK